MRARYHSLSRARCEQAFEHPEDLGTPRKSRPALAEIQRLGDTLAVATESALARAGLTATKSELHQLLRALLERPGGERWGLGEDIAALAANASRSASVRAGALTPSSTP